MFQKHFRPSILVPFLALSVVFAAPVDPVPEEVVIVIEKHVLTTRDLDFWALDARLRRREDASIPLASYHRAVASRAVDTFLLGAWADLLLEDPTPDLIDAEMNGAIREYERLAGGAERLEDQIRDAGLDSQDFRIWVREKENNEYLASQALMTYASLAGASPVDGELRDATRLRVAHILVKNSGESGKEQALRIRRDVAAGLPFHEAAKLYSEDTVTGESGGELGWFSSAELAPELWAAAVSAPRGDVPDPVQTGAGWHLVRVLDLETPRQREWAIAMRKAEDAQLKRLRQESDIRLSPGFELRSLSSAESGN